MTSPLRNAARALVLAQDGADIFDDLEPEAQERAVEHARAVILAIREPTQGMMNAKDSVDPGIPDRDTADVWQAMIDAALSDA